MNGCELQIDVSSAQGPNIDWLKVKADKQGITRAVIKIQDGNNGPDLQGLQNVTRARQAGFEPEGYACLFPLPLDGVHANRGPIEQAKLFAARLETLGLEDGAAHCDFEWPNPFGKEWSHYGCSPAQTLDWVDAATTWLENQGFHVWLYGSKYFYDSIGARDRLSIARFPHWAADPCLLSQPIIPQPFTTWGAWQYTWTGRVDGYAGPVDLSWRRVGT